MYSEWEEMNEKYKLGKLFTEKIATTKEAKDALNELSLLINSYAVAMLKENKTSVTKEDIDEIYSTLE